MTLEEAILRKLLRELFKKGKKIQDRRRYSRERGKRRKKGRKHGIQAPKAQ